MRNTTRAFDYLCPPTEAGSNILLCCVLFMLRFVQVLITQVLNSSRPANKVCRFETKISSLYMSISWRYQWKETCPAISWHFKLFICSSCKLKWITKEILWVLCSWSFLYIYFLITDGKEITEYGLEDRYLTSATQWTLFLLLHADVLWSPGSQSNRVLVIGTFTEETLSKCRADQLPVI